MLQALLEAGADVNAQNEVGVTSLMLAATNSNLPLVQALLTAGADVNTWNEKGGTALTMAAAKPENLPVLQALRGRYSCETL